MKPKPVVWVIVLCLIVWAGLIWSTFRVGIGPLLVAAAITLGWFAYEIIRSNRA